MLILNIFDCIQNTRIWNYPQRRNTPITNTHHHLLQTPLVGRTTAASTRIVFNIFCFFLFFLWFFNKFDIIIKYQIKLGNKNFTCSNTVKQCKKISNYDLFFSADFTYYRHTEFRNNINLTWYRAKPWHRSIILMGNWNDWPISRLRPTSR